jgi:hypothetical protein
VGGVVSFSLLDDRLLEHPKFATLDDAGLALWLRALVFANRYRTNGVLDRATLATIRARPKIIRELVARRIWDAAPDGYRIHDFLAYNFDRDGRKPPRPPASYVPPTLHAARAAAGRKGAATRWGEGTGKSPDDGKTDGNCHSKPMANDGKTAAPMYPRSQDPKVKEHARAPKTFENAGDFFAPLLHALKAPEDAE